MTSIMKNFTDAWRASFSGTLGIAVDEAALVVAMVAGAGAFGVVAANYNGIGFGGGFGSGISTEKALEQLHDVERANLAFHDTFKKWPHEMTDGKPTHNAAVLAKQDVMKFPYSTLPGHRRLVSEATFEYDPETKTLRHNFGKGGRVMQEVVFGPDGRSYLSVAFEDVPLYQAQEMDRAVDGVYDPDSGKFTLTLPDSVVDAETVTVHYLANRL